MQKNYTKKIFMTQIIMMVWSLTYSQTSWNVKWALESITTNKVSGGDGIPVELSQILKDDAVKVLHSICQHIWKTQQWPQDWKRSLFLPIPKKGNPKECSNYHTIALICDYTKAFDCVDHNKLENSERDGYSRPPDLPFEKPVCRSVSNS